MTTLADFRKQKDDFFRTDRQSPLTPEQRADFHGLAYYPENPDLRLEVALEPAEDVEVVVLPTSAGTEQEYFHIGQVRFKVGGKAATLQVYEPVDGGDYFVPFVDAGAPAETYGAGRYLEPEDLPDGRLLLDFNLAYNPYCAYNDRWVCPLPPQENRLAVRIEAGEKKFHA
jgi:uncharacterized protein (DUF1684 family)